MVRYTFDLKIWLDGEDWGYVNYLWIPFDPFSPSCPVEPAQNKTKKLFIELNAK